MNARQIKFAQEYLRDGNATQAAIRAGYSQISAHTQGSDLLKLPEIKSYIAEKEAEAARIATLDRAWLLGLYMDIASADVNAIMSVMRINCRHCHGFGGQYQWTEREYMDAVDQAIAKGEPAPDGMGGFGYDQMREPNPKCTECNGDGVERVRVADTRKIEGPARRLFAGVEQTKFGIKVRTQDQAEARAFLARHLGMAPAKTEISGPNGAPIGIDATVRAEDLSDDQLARFLGNVGE